MDEYQWQNKYVPETQEEGVGYYILLIVFLIVIVGIAVWLGE